ncbi:hypothetical protein JVU11DRAFT_12088 [Chiua virens]|nr:hypothetical protein JVU11DRAFT_12088 [Chiua virens]
MKFSVVLALAAAVTVVSAETNAQRMARGLPPMAPAKRATPVQQKRHKPSGTPPPPGGQCNTGDVMCCNSFQQTTSHGGSPVDTLLGQLGLLNVPVGTNCGLSCDPISVIGTGSGAECQSQPVCCQNNDYTGLINSWLQSNQHQCLKYWLLEYWLLLGRAVHSLSLAYTLLLSVFNSYPSFTCITQPLIPVDMSAQRTFTFSIVFGCDGGLCSQECPAF